MVPRARVPGPEEGQGTHLGLGAALQDIQELSAEAFQLGQADPGGRSKMSAWPGGGLGEVCGEGAARVTESGRGVCSSAATGGVPGRAGPLSVGT